MSNRSRRTVVELAALTALLTFSFAPSPHLHAAPAGSAIIHRHVIDHDAEHAGASLDHSDHHSSTTLDTEFDFQRRYSVDAPLITPVAGAVTLNGRLVGPIFRMDPPLTHGPPIRIRSLRAPPA